MRNAGKVASNLSHANLATGQHTAWFGEKQGEEHHRRAFGKGTVDLLHTISACNLTDDKKILYNKFY